MPSVSCENPVSFYKVLMIIKRANARNDLESISPIRRLIVVVNSLTPPTLHRLIFSTSPLSSFILFNLVQLFLPTNLFFQNKILCPTPIPIPLSLQITRHDLANKVKTSAKTRGDKTRERQQKRPRKKHKKKKKSSPHGRKTTAGFGSQSSSSISTTSSSSNDDEGSSTVSTANDNSISTSTTTTIGNNDNFDLVRGSMAKGRNHQRIGGEENGGARPSSGDGAHFSRTYVCVFA